MFSAGHTETSFVTRSKSSDNPTVNYSAVHVISGLLCQEKYIVLTIYNIILF